ncbi:MAG: cytidine deaminase [Mycobacteriales bacterium]
MSEVAATDPEDDKLVTLARTARGRAYAPYTGAAEGAAVRDTDGRTYAAATVEHHDPALTTTALRAALVAAASSGARAFDAVALVSATAARPAVDDLRLLFEFGETTRVLLATPDGAVVTAARATDLV